jgi:sugar (pentulose or hexulose) kinase
MGITPPRSIVVLDVGYTNSKAILFRPDLTIVTERKIPSTHRVGRHYREIDIEPVLAFFADVLPELDQLLPVDCIVTSSHGACIAAAKEDGTLAVPLMDYMSEPPADIVAAYKAQCPSYAETYSPQLPVALLHAMQLFWQQRVLPDDFAKATTITPLMQYIAMRLGGKPVSEMSSMGCQSHLLNLNTLQPSSLAMQQGWAAKFAPRANAWDVIGTLSQAFRGSNFKGHGDILAGVHDSNANYLRYLCGNNTDFTLLSTGTWIIGFDTRSDIKSLDPARDIVANVDVLGRVVACCRFFGGKEFEIVSKGAAGNLADIASVTHLIDSSVMALPSFTDSGGPVPNTGNLGRVIGTLESPAEYASLASLYCALMVNESLAAIHSGGDIIVDGPFAENDVFLHILATLRPRQQVRASLLREGTAAGAACLALMSGGLLPEIDITMRHIKALDIDLKTYQANWQKELPNAHLHS